MWFKLFNEKGNYEDITTKESKNMLCSPSKVHTPEGLNKGWTEFHTEEEAMTYFHIEKKV